MSYHPKVDEQVAQAVGGTLYQQTYIYKCKICGENHTVKEGSAEICTMEIKGEE